MAQMKNDYNNSREERLYSYITSSGQIPNLNTRSPMNNSTANTSIEWQRMMKKQTDKDSIVNDDMKFGSNDLDDLEIDNESLFYQA